MTGFRAARSVVTCVALLLLAVGRAAAADIEVYESIAQIEIGPVFLTPADRRRLDEWRRAGTPTAATAPVEPGIVAGDSPTERQASGYIISSSGLRSEWSGSDFVPARDPALARRRFPGDVQVVRHRSAAPVEESDDRDDDK